MQTVQLWQGPAPCGFHREGSWAPGAAASAPASRAFLHRAACPSPSQAQSLRGGGAAPGEEQSTTHPLNRSAVGTSSGAGEGKGSGPAENRALGGVHSPGRACHPAGAGGEEEPTCPSWLLGTRARAHPRRHIPGCGASPEWAASQPTLPSLIVPSGRGPYPAQCPRDTALG